MTLTPLELAAVCVTVGYTLGRLHRHHVVTRPQTGVWRLSRLLAYTRRERDTALAAVADERRRLARSVGHPSVRPLVPDTVEEVRKVGRW